MNNMTTMDGHWLNMGWIKMICNHFQSFLGSILSSYGRFYKLPNASVVLWVTINTWKSAHMCIQDIEVTEWLYEQDH